MNCEQKKNGNYRAKQIIELNILDLYIQVRYILSSLDLAKAYCTTEKDTIVSSLNRGNTNREKEKERANFGYRSSSDSTSESGSHLLSPSF
jgi:hypothetical protein